ncbi:oligopeptide/dipeptide ABC transporter ATP-binding protein [Streptomyces sp. NPDC087440]|uniref:oligopeptide/dipeptide ABC transporter ATP-binding protein n=1 Tax=Streptomyces sp. NPDC087440 TaxID=3365790 RepID=UPI0038051629
MRPGTKRSTWTPALVTGAVLLAVFAALALVAPWIWGARADELTGAAHQPTSAAHWFGTDALGRDVFARTMTATRPTLLMTLAATAVAAVGGIGLGAAIWVAGARVRELGQRLIDVLISYPSVIFALIVAAVLGPGGTTSVAAIGLATCPAFARLTTNLAASVAGRDFVPTARLLGVSPLRLLRRHILPNIAEPLLVLVSVAFAASLKALSGLSFLGLGADFDWGRLLFTGLEGIYVNPAPALGPAVAIVLAGLAGGLIGDGLAASADRGSGAASGRGAGPGLWGRRQVRAALRAALRAAEAGLAGANAGTGSGARSGTGSGARSGTGVGGRSRTGVGGRTGTASGTRSGTARAGSALVPDPARATSSALPAAAPTTAPPERPTDPAPEPDTAPVPGPGSHRDPHPDALVSVDGLSVRLADATVLVDGVSLHVGEGEVVGIVGESGSGKSVTAMALARLLPDGLTADARTVRVGDLDLAAAADPDPRRLAADIGIVYQDPSASFNPTLRLGGQLTEVLRVHAGVSRADADRRAAEQLEAAKVTLPRQRLRQHPHELSGGMRQRAMIAAALLTRPRLIVADEPTTALDVTVQAEVLKLLRQANTTDGTSVLLISHDIGVVSGICDRVLVMYAGRLVEELEVADLRAGRAHHPYTRALLAATPSLDDDAPPQPIPGRPPQPAERPAGCAFAPRCALAREQCVEERPMLRTEGPRAACHALDWEPAHA